MNGIRGKSTVTRIIAGMMREAGIVDDRQVDRDVRGGHQPAWRRRADRPPGPGHDPRADRGLPALRAPEVQALVIECMALKPEYQEVSERMIVRSNIGVLTNVREDHQDVMGETLPEIARSLLSTCPRDGILVTVGAEPGDPRRDARGVRRPGQRADRRRSRRRHRRGHQPLRLHRLQGERLHRARRSPTSSASLATWRWTAWSRPTPTPACCA